MSRDKKCLSMCAAQPRCHCRQAGRAAEPFRPRRVDSLAAIDLLPLYRAAKQCCSPRVAGVCLRHPAAARFHHALLCWPQVRQHLEAGRGGEAPTAMRFPMSMGAARIDVDHQGTPCLGGWRQGGGGWGGGLPASARAPPASPRWPGDAGCRPVIAVRRETGTSGVQSPACPALELQAAFVHRFPACSVGLHPGQRPAGCLRAVPPT